MLYYHFQENRILKFMFFKIHPVLNTVSILQECLDLLMIVRLFLLGLKCFKILFLPTVLSILTQSIESLCFHNQY